MVEPLAACKGGPLDPAFLSSLDAEETETWAPLSTRNHLLEMLPVTKSCVCLWFSEVETAQCSALVFLCDYV